MHRNYFVLRRLGIALGKELSNSVFDNAFSTGKNELFLVFRDKNSFFNIRLSFELGQVFFRFPEELSMPGKSMPWFRDLSGARLQEVICPVYDRKLLFRFENAEQLQLRLYAPKPDVIYGKEGEISLEAFRDRKSHELLSSAHIQNPELLLPEVQISDEKQLLREHPYFKGEIAEQFRNKGFFHQDIGEQRKRLISHWNYLMDPKFFTGISGIKNILSIYEFPGSEEFNEIIPALNRFAGEFLRDFQLTHTKEQLLRSDESELKKLKKTLEAAKLRLTELHTEVPLEEKAHILMANLHLIPPAASEIKLHDFYREQPIIIKLNPKLNAQQNAEMLYRKAKNRHIELHALEEKISLTIKHIKELQERMELVKSSDDRQFLKKLLISSVAKETGEPDPYREFDFMGWKILLGKSARSNDELISRFAKKNDTWLHARNFSGSHVIIKDQAGKAIPKPVLEKAASLAAWHSKGKTESLCPVIYTERKYVRKPKGAAPGQVLVEKEQVIMVKPSAF